MIYGERVRLRAPERSDLSQFVEWFNDPEVREGILMILPLSLAREEKWFDDMIKKPEEEQVLVIEIELEEKWTIIGTCGFFGFDWRCRSAEVGIVIGEKTYWNQGYGTETMRMMLKHGFDSLNLNRIALDVYDSNRRAIRAYEKAGFIREGIKRRGMFKDGRYIDIIMMSVLRSEWKE